MKLTREQAIAEHRKMWNWIADETERTRHVAEKHDYFIQNGIDGQLYTNSECFCCEYVCQLGVARACSLCPIDWGSDMGIKNNCINSLYTDWYYCGSPDEAAKLARQIANLPERTDNIPVSK